MDMEISYRYGGREMLDEVAPLWKGLNAHLQGVASHFQEHYRSMDFDRRRREILTGSKDGILVIIASDDEDLAYSVATLNGEEGWIDSIFIVEEHRGRGIGEELMRRSVEWLKDRGAKRILLTVTPGNDSVIGFYERFGFRPRKIVMELDGWNNPLKN